MKKKYKMILDALGKVHEEFAANAVDLSSNLEAKMKGGTKYANTGCFNISCSDSNSGCSNSGCSGNNYNCH